MRPSSLPRLASRLAPTALLCVLALASTGCDRDTEERQLSEMTSEIDHLRVDRDEANRELLEPDVADTHASSVPPRLPAPAQPPAPVVKLGDEAASGELESPDTDDPTPRPTIRVIGSSRRGDAQSVTDEVPTDASGAARPGALDPAAKRDYEAALSMVTARQYDAALDALAAFLVKYPDHPYADNALFWRGECYYAKGDYLHAAEQFEGVFTRFPAGNKAPDALLKLGMSRMKLGDPAKAKEIFDRLAQTYPQSDAAHRIPTVRVPATTPSGPASEDHR
jgi:tol-pal system protein YbgF